MIDLTLIKLSLRVVSEGILIALCAVLCFVFIVSRPSFFGLNLRLEIAFALHVLCAALYAVVLIVKKELRSPFFSFMILASVLISVASEGNCRYQEYTFKKTIDSRRVSGYVLETFFQNRFWPYQSSYIYYSPELDEYGASD
ncbi:MAG: hypothetical protein V3V20_12255 [Algisphaera sp.]